MKALFFLALFLGAVLAPTAARAATIFPYPVHVQTLDNGLQVIVVPMSSGGLVAYWTLVRTGSRDETEAGRTGFAHFFEHMMFRGTDKYPADVYNAKLTAIGADANAFTSDDLTAYHLGITKDDVELVMELESDRFQNLKYTEQVFQTEAGAVYGEYRKLRSNPFFTMFEGMRKVAFERHTYGHTTMGFVEDVQAMPTLFDHSRTFFSRFYRPENTILLLIGDLDPARTHELAKKYYGGWQKGYQPATIPAEPEQKAERRVEVPYEGQSLPILWLAYKSEAFDPDNKRQVAMSLLCDLAFGETSDTFRKLVIEEQLVEFVNCDAGLSRDPGTIDVLARVKDPAKVDAVMAELDATIARFQEKAVDAEKLKALQSRNKYGFLMSLDTPMRTAESLVRYLALTGRADTVDRLFTTLTAATPQDVLDAARFYLVKERRTVAVLKGAK